MYWSETLKKRISGIKSMVSHILLTSKRIVPGLELAIAHTQ